MQLWKHIKTPVTSKFTMIAMPILIMLITLNIMGVGWMFTEGRSMEPTSYSGDVLVYMNPWFLKVGDDITFETPLENWPEEMGRIWHKRIHHFKGDDLWLLGDNVEVSFDSRFIGYVNKKQVRKKVLFIIHRHANSETAEG